MITIDWGKAKDTFQFPIAILLSPFGVVPLLYMFMMYSLSFDIAPDKLEHKRWAISTSLYIVGIFGAVGVAVLAQYIFNKNARKREDRERRLSAVQEIILNANLLDKTFFRYCSGSINNSDDNFLAVISTSETINTLSLLYHFSDINSDLDQINEVLQSIHETINLKIEKFELDNQPLTGLINKIIGLNDRYEFSRHLAEIKIKAINIHNDIEKNPSQ